LLKEDFSVIRATTNHCLILSTLQRYARHFLLPSWNGNQEEDVWIWTGEWKTKWPDPDQASRVQSQRKPTHRREKMEGKISPHPEPHGVTLYDK
jgi:hypothetical protein